MSRRSATAEPSGTKSKNASAVGPLAPPIMITTRCVRLRWYAMAVVPIMAVVRLVAKA